jgi:hypothetical protein
VDARRRPHRFYAKIALDPNRPTPQVSNIAQSILSYQSNNLYSSQSLNLGFVPNKFYLRANIWLTTQSLHPINHEGEARLYSYDLPHDHNFDFLASDLFFVYRGPMESWNK